MNEKQTINCTVSTCKFNNESKQKCKLDQIQVSPCINCQTTTPDESMCSSYIYSK